MTKPFVFKNPNSIEKNKPWTAAGDGVRPGYYEFSSMEFSSATEAIDAAIQATRSMSEYIWAKCLDACWVAGTPKRI